MKKNLLLVALALFGCANVFAQEDAEVLKETFTPTSDTFVRSSAADKKYGSDDNMEIFTSSDGTDFVGLMSFNVPEKEGYEVSKATLVLHSKRVKGDRKLTIYPFDYAISEGDDTWNTQKDNVAVAREEAPIISDVELNGQNGKDVGDDLSDGYKTADAWKNEFDITDYVTTLDGGDVNLLLTHKGENNNQEVRIYTKEVKDVTLKDGVTVFKADDLKPILVVEYAPTGETAEKETVIPTADTFVRSSAADKKFGSDDNMEIFTSSDGTDFVGLMSFNVPEKEGYEVSKATLVLHSKRVKGDRKLTIYPFDYAISEGDDTWNTQKDNVAVAREEAPIISDVELNGQNGKDVGDDLSDGYKTADAWKNEFDITDYVTTLDGGDVNLLLTHKGENNNQEVRIYTKEVKDVTLKDGVTVFKAEDLCPKLVITYTTATGINEVETVEPVAKAKDGIYTLSGVRVAKANRPGIYIINGKKVLVRNK